MSEHNLKTVLAAAVQRLASAGCATPRLDAEVLLAQVLGQERAWLHTHWLNQLTPAQIDHFSKLLTRRERREPVPYIVGRKAFFALDFLVNRHVLIPRPETEQLVETVIELAESRPSPAVADIGTGSGCIAVALAKQLPQASIVAVDLSGPALAVAHKNRAYHHTTRQITFVLGDLLLPLTGPFDFIVSNPPYVSQAELRTAMPEVGHYEPQLALAAGADGFNVIRRLLPQAKTKLKPGGALLIEIGANQGQAGRSLAKQIFPEGKIILKKDLVGLDRVLMIKV